jgi:hypothetical protein
MLHFVRALLSTWKGRVIAGFVLVQLLLPLHYYTVRRDKHDERFSWRMFSSMRMLRCEPKFQIDDRPLPLASTFHEAWVEIARRGRLRIVEAMSAQLCARNPGQRVQLDLACHYLDGSTRTFSRFDMCPAVEL